MAVFVFIFKKSFCIVVHTSHNMHLWEEEELHRFGNLSKLTGTLVRFVRENACTQEEIVKLMQERKSTHVC